MPRTWSWCASSALLAAALLVGGPTPAGAATVVEHQVQHTVTADGEIRQAVRYVVRLEHDGELERYSPYYIALDEHRRLRDVEAWTVTPSGGRQKVRGRRQDTLEVPSGGVLHSSERYHEISFPPVAAGWTLGVAYEVEIDPYFPAASVNLGGEEPVEVLRVEVRGAPPTLRWRIDGPGDGLEVAETAGGLLITGHDLPGSAPADGAPDRVGDGPVLRYAWGEATDWAAVGRWYRQLIAPLERLPEAVRREARRLVDGLTTPRQRLARLAEHVQREVRYVAVEVGVGGYRPSAPGEVLERRWGDCKDKSFLLIDLLAEAGIEAYPALVLADRGDRIDRAFPAPNQFNHLIVAVPVAALDGAPTAVDEVDRQDAGAGAGASTGNGDYLFVDATQTRGGIDWLHPAVQGQDALVVRPDGGVLVTVPLHPELEAQRLSLNLTVTAEGDGRGGAGLELSGAGAASFSAFAAASSPDDVETLTRRLFALLLPAGVDLGAVSWSPQEGGDGTVPSASLAAAVRLPGLVEGAGERRSFRLPGEPRLTLPEADEATQRRLPRRLAAGTTEVQWTLTLPAGWCAPDGPEAELANDLGHFEQRLSADGNRLTILRRTEVRQRWAEPEQLAAVRELALAETRTLKRRFRLRCDGE